MSESDKILLTGKSFFWISFCLGNICLFGYLLTGNEKFAMAGFFLLFYAAIANLGVLVGLLVYSVVKPKLRTACYRSALILLINIPIAIVYTIIGITIV